MEDRLLRKGCGEKTVRKGMWGKDCGERDGTVGNRCGDGTVGKWMWGRLLAANGCGQGTEEMDVGGVLGENGCGEGSWGQMDVGRGPVSYTHLRAHETG